MDLLDEIAVFLRAWLSRSLFLFEAPPCSSLLQTCARPRPWRIMNACLLMCHVLNTLTRCTSNIYLMEGSQVRLTNLFVSRAFADMKANPNFFWYQGGAHVPVQFGVVHRHLPACHQNCWEAWAESSTTFDGLSSLKMKLNWKSCDWTWASKKHWKKTWDSAVEHWGFAESVHQASLREGLHINWFGNVWCVFAVLRLAAVHSMESDTRDGRCAIRSLPKIN